MLAAVLALAEATGSAPPAEVDTTTRTGTISVPLPLIRGSGNRPVMFGRPGRGRGTPPRIRRGVSRRARVAGIRRRKAARR